MEYTGANEAYIALIKRLAATEPAVAEKAANSLLKKSYQGGKDTDPRGPLSKSSFPCKIRKMP